MSDAFGPLQEATTEELLEEIGRRMDAFVFAGTVHPTDSTPGTLLRELHGNRLVCLGLLSHATHRLNLDFHAEMNGDSES